MNKTVTINIAGIVFHIEEDAYEFLKQYLSDVKRSFNGIDGHEEIMADIELRIAEIFQEKNGIKKQVLVIQDIEDMISVMGKPSEFRENENKENEQPKGASTSFSKEQRRLFRDPDDKVLGGVCSGISAYFNIDPVWLRLAFGISLLFFGTGIILYVLLWIALPAANSTAEKLQMRGEDVNVENIKKAIKDELKDLEKRMENFAKEASSSVTSQKNKEKAANFFQKLIDVLKNIFEGLINVLVKFTGFILLLIGLALLIFITGSSFQFFHLPGASQEIFNALFSNNDLRNISMIGIVLVLGIPVISMVYGGLKILLGFKGKIRILGGLFSLLWLTGLVIIIYSGYLLADDFKCEAEESEEMQLNNIDTINISLRDNDNKQQRTRTYYWINNSRFDFIYEEESRSIKRNIRFNIKSTDRDSMFVEIFRSARGSNSKDAFSRARKIRYNIEQQKNELLLDRFSYSSVNDKWRKQEIEVTLKLPVGKVVYLNKNTTEVLHNIENVNNTWDKDMVERKWMMTKEGLHCVDCEGISEK